MWSLRSLQAEAGAKSSLQGGGRLSEGGLRAQGSEQGLSPLHLRILVPLGPALRPPPQRALRAQQLQVHEGGSTQCRPGGGGEEPVSWTGQSHARTPQSQPSPPPQGSLWSSRGHPPHTLLLPPGPPPSASKDPKLVPVTPQGQLLTNPRLGGPASHTHIHPLLDDLEHGDDLWIQLEAQSMREIFCELDFSL